jgi:endonuclease/exonuclease/phosphatase family metal-dependent hydrolase
MTDDFVEIRVCALEAPSQDVLAAAANAPPTLAEHHGLAAASGVFDAVECGNGGTSVALDAPIRVAAWNGERLKFASDSAEFVRRAGADILFLTESDVGMARSDNRHTCAELAAALGMSYAFGVEFLELGLGDGRERETLGGAANRLGFHGNAILSRGPIGDPFVLRLDDGGVWWTNAKDGQQRLGWRMAVGGWVELGTTRVLVASAHLESKSDAADRAAQVARLVRCLDARAEGAPILVGGDFNTKDLPGETGEAGWFEHPDGVEPLFAELRKAGFVWEDANTAETTQRPSRTSTPATPHRRLDWLFHRGLKAWRPTVLPALDTAGAALSDHDLVAADFRTA